MFDISQFGLPKPYYQTEMGASILGDARTLLSRLPDNSIDLIVTSPPFALTRKKEYGNVRASDYVEWFRPFARSMWRVLKETGSLVLNLGGAWQPGYPIRSLYQFEVLIDLCRETENQPPFFLAQEFYWYNPARLPSPAEWVTVRRIRVKDSVDTIWWLSKTPNPKSKVSEILWPYSAAMRRLIERGSYNTGPRPSGWDISDKFTTDNGGAIPPNILPLPFSENGQEEQFGNAENLLPIANTESNNAYSVGARKYGFKIHPARFPIKLPSHFIRFLTEETDIVLDPFAGSVTTGEAAESLNRRWIAFEKEIEYLRVSRFRFPNVPRPRMRKSVDTSS